MTKPKPVVCQCPHPYIGTQWVGLMNIYCESCGGLVDVAAADRLEKIHDEAMARLKAHEDVDHDGDL